MTVYEKLIALKEQKQKEMIALLDPDKKNKNDLKNQIEYINSNNFCAILVGGSLIMDSFYNDRVEMIKGSTDLPIISFPSSACHINKNFDAILFISLISGRNPQYLIGEQVLSAPIIHDFKIESIPVGYILLDGGVRSSVEIVSDTKPIPMEKSDIVLAHALASQYLGHKFIYLECGSNAVKSIDLKLLKKIKKHVEIPLFVGGGIKDSNDIENIYNAGADFIVIGSIIEEKAKILK